MKRVGFTDGEDRSWVNESADIDPMACGSLTQNDMGADGNPPVEFKNGIKHRVAGEHNAGISNMCDEDVLVGACLVAVVKRIT